MHRLPMYADCPRAPLPVAEKLERSVINLPSAPSSVRSRRRMARRKICVVTGSRAEYGLLYWPMRAIAACAGRSSCSSWLTGMHLSPEFGATYGDRRARWLRYRARVEMLLSCDTPVGIAKSLGLGLIGFADALDRLEPDFVRAARRPVRDPRGMPRRRMIARLPIAHSHGGETDRRRHRRVDPPRRHQDGASPLRCHGGISPAGDPARRATRSGSSSSAARGSTISVRLELMSRDEMERALDFRLGRGTCWSPFTRPTLEEQRRPSSIRGAADGARGAAGHDLVFTLPNADTDGRAHRRQIEEFVAGAPGHVASFHVARAAALSVLHAPLRRDSRQLLERSHQRRRRWARPRVNIGDRQHGRLRASSVIDCEPTAAAIAAALATRCIRRVPQRSSGVRQSLWRRRRRATRSSPTLRTISLDGSPKKRFYDLPVDLTAESCG